MRYQIRQGDVYLVPIDTPKNVLLRPVERENGRVVLAHGEVTGHAHAFSGPQTMLLEPETPFGVPGITDPVSRVVFVPEPDTMVHEEHSAIPVTPDNVGHFALITPREYTPWGERAVRD